MKLRMIKRFSKREISEDLVITDHKPFEVSDEEGAKILKVGGFVECPEAVIEETPEPTGPTTEIIDNLEKKPESEAPVSVDSLPTIVEDDEKKEEEKTEPVVEDKKASGDIVDKLKEKVAEKSANKEK